MHNRVRGDGSRWWVPMFNPASNPNQRSRLRIVNTEVDAVDLSIGGTDDAGASAGIVSLSLSGLSSIELDVTDLENGNTGLGLSGALGDGDGKWRWQVHAMGRISVQSLLSDPNGNLTNRWSLPNPAQTAPGERNVWLVPAAANVEQQGFVRLINRESRSRDVVLWGIDDAGQRSPESITLTLAPNESRQLNSNDLKSGNVGKGLTGSLGTGTGDWRLKVLSDLDLVPMAFIRTPGGFLTAMHDTVAGDGLLVQVPIFNPGENRNQVSSLRLINDNATAARIRIGGRDDAGVPAANGEATLMLAAGAAITLSARELEARSRSGAAWDEIHVAGPFELTIAPPVGPQLSHFLGDYQALVVTGELFIPFFVTANNSNLRNLPNRTDVFVAPARSLLGTLAPLTAGPISATALTRAQTTSRYATAADADLMQDERVRRRIDDNIVRVMEARIPGWSRIMRAPAPVPPPQ